MAAGQNQRSVTGPRPTLTTYPVTKGMQQAGACREDPLINITVLSHPKLRDKPRQRVCNRPRASYLVTEGCWHGPSGTGF